MEPQSEPEKRLEKTQKMRDEQNKQDNGQGKLNKNNKHLRINATNNKTLKPNTTDIRKRKTRNK